MLLRYNDMLVTVKFYSELARAIAGEGPPPVTTNEARAISSDSLS